MSTSQILFLEHTSRVLEGNPLGDPHRRRLPVYLPPGYDDQPERRYPVIWMLAGFSGWGERLLNLSAWDENIQQRLDRLIGQGAVPPLIMALPDCFTRYGGSQYINSTATGRYEDYIVEELVPFVDERLRTLPEAAHRAVMGKSSGGYGTLGLAMRHPDVFGALACHSGDMFFEYCYYNDFPRLVNGLAAYDGKPEAFLEKFDKIPPHERDRNWRDVINVLAMSACYSPNPESPLGFDLPCDTHTGELIPAVWERWLAWDPVNMVEAHVEALRAMRCLYLDCGTKDEFNLHLGARVLARKLEHHRVPFHHEEFEAGHFDVSYRYDVSLPMLAAAINPT